jgi:hypothetical protein
MKNEIESAIDIPTIIIITIGQKLRPDSSIRGINVIAGTGTIRLNPLKKAMVKTPM